MKRETIREYIKLNLIFLPPIIGAELYGLYQTPLSFLFSAICVTLGIGVFFVRWCEWKEDVVKV